MSKYDDSPVYRINKWVTDSLRLDGVIPPVEEYVNDLDTQDNFAIPFMTAGQQQPEQTTQYNDGYKSLPFCAYTVEQRGGHGQPWSKCGEITYIFYSGDINKLVRIGNYVHDLTNREDWSATDINYFYRLDATYPYDFKCISFVSGAGPAVARDEGGRHAYMCVIDYEATYEGTGRTNDYSAETGLGRI